MSRRIDLTTRTTASLEQVWAAWTDPARLAEWFVDRATGAPRVGESYVWSWDDFGVQPPMRVLVVDPEKALALEFPSPGGVLEVTLRRDGGDTVIHLVNSGFTDAPAWEDEFLGIRHGWTMALAVLQVYVERYWQHAKQQVGVFLPTSASFEAIAREYRRPAAWLELGVPLPGAVLVDVGREVSYRWDNLDAVLELKSFESGGRRSLGARIISWRPSPLPGGLKDLISASLTRLAGRLAA
jgi:uncharacterized protein YndB with AHSA1/START domain